MVAIATPVAQVADLATLSPTAQAAALGYPATLLGYTPEQRAYWFEPGLPWFTAELYDNPPIGYHGLSLIRHFGDVAGNHMAPRFPKGCVVNTAPVCEKKNLVLGRVYTYRFLNSETGAYEHQMGRLVKIGGNYLEVKADNNPTPSIWLLREVEAEAVWDVWEVTHYVSYPGEQEGASRE